MQISVKAVATYVVMFEVGAFDDYDFIKFPLFYECKGLSLLK